MAKEMQRVDVSNIPELVRIAEEVQKTHRPRLLGKDKEDLAIIVPLGPSRRLGARGRLYTKDDSLFNIIGLAQGPGDDATDVSENKYKYLAEAYAPKPQ